jgi:hypothetical protein
MASIAKSTVRTRAAASTISQNINIPRSTLTIPINPSSPRQAQSQVRLALC